ncbi:restriction endonuclease subunit S [Enterococcus hirae]
MSNDTQPEIRFPGFTEAWEQRKLSELATINARIGWQNLRTSEFLDNGDYMLITGTDFKDGAIDYSNIHYVEKERFEQDKKIQISNGSILITKDGTLGKVAYVEGLTMPATLNAGVFNVRVKEDLAIDSRYLFHYLKAPFLLKFADQRSTGGTIKHLNQNVLVEFPIPLPSLEEQHKVARLLSNFDNVLALHQRKLDLLKETKKGFLQKMFPKNGAKVPEIRFPGFTGDWEDREFSEIVKTTGYKAYLSEAFEVGEYPVIQQGDKPILGYSDKKPFENFEDVVLFGDHTLSLYKPETPFLVATDGLKIITVPNFSGSFLLSLLEKYVPESQGYKRHFTILKKEQVAFPTDVKERVLIGEFFTQIDRTITLHERELDLLKETKKGFLQKMFV